MQLRHYLFLFCLLIHNFVCASESVASKQEMHDTISAYLKLSDKITQDADIKRLAQITTDDFEYYQPSFDIHFSKEQWLRALKDRLSNEQTRNITTQITAVEFALNVAFVKQQSQWEQNVNGKWYGRSSNDLVTLFEFSNGKISAVREYW